MCFSPTASFALSGILTTVGVIAVARAGRPAQRMFAATPLVFALQQASEGVVWLTIDAPAHTAALAVAVRLFLGFALVLWPAWVPVSLWLCERRPGRRRALFFLGAFGVAFALAALFLLLHFPSAAKISDRSLTYDFAMKTSGFVHVVILATYIGCTVLPFFIATSRLMRAFGVLLVVAVAAAMIVRAEALTSVWCFFAAGLSLLVAVAVGEVA